MKFKLMTISILLIMTMIGVIATDYNPTITFVKDLPSEKNMHWEGLTNGDYEIYFKFEVSDYPFAYMIQVSSVTTISDCRPDVLYGGKVKQIPIFSDTVEFSDEMRDFLTDYGQQDIDSDYADSNKWIADPDISEPYLCYVTKITAATKDPNGIIKTEDSTIMSMKIFDGDSVPLMGSVFKLDAPPFIVCVFTIVLINYKRRKLKLK